MGAGRFVAYTIAGLFAVTIIDASQMASAQFFGMPLLSGQPAAAPAAPPAPAAEEAPPPAKPVAKPKPKPKPKPAAAADDGSMAPADSAAAPPAAAKPKPKTKPKPKPAAAASGSMFAPETPVAAPAPAKPARAAKPATGNPAAAKTAAAKPVAGKGVVLVDNRRETTLIELTITPKAANSGGPVVIARGVSSGGRVNAKLPAKGGCIFDVSGSFEDESTLDVASVNLCKDPRLTLVE